MLTTAIAMWNAVYLERAAAGMRALGGELPEEYLAHLSPLEWEHITLTGVYHRNLESMLQELDGLKPLRGIPIQPDNTTNLLVMRIFEKGPK